MAIGLGALISFCVLALVIVLFMTRRPPGGERGERGEDLRIPAAAMWHGGVDGGSFIELLDAKNDQQFHLRIYRDGSGDLEADGWFQLSDNCRDQRVSAAQFHELVQGYDGEQVHVTTGDARGGCSLKRAPSRIGASSTIVYRINRRRVPQPEFEKLKSELELSETFSQGELVRGGSRGKQHEHGFVHIWEARQPRTGKKFQYSVEAFDEETIYSIQAVNK